MKILMLLVIVVLALIAFRPGLSFKSQKVADYAANGPAFDIRVALSGALVSEGLIYGPTGRVTSRFLAEFTGVWDGDSGTLAEEFTYDTGNSQSRKWTLTMGENGHFTATASDVIGEAKGQQMGNAVRMTYKIRLPVEAGSHVLDVTDWLYLMENGTILNRSQMRKFGIKVAELIATMRPVK
ncbi:DUF3833 domain-containing protein [uncultured Lentibacter sp.]|uniref:DUF3833 domain-containing protein n=1 Tax=uncultured Lentibacter sp. TaxID=1659309 RepID=UPI002612ECFC|nr:DUF3833 domain-containing protein [uncultured Lentibacter sp.]MCW1955027.1 DUF3833 domain-containing protein [Roseobacter sp.]